MRYPSKEKLKQMESKLKKAKGTLMVGSSSSPAEKLRWELCQNLVRYMIENELSQVALSKLLQVDQSRVSEIVHHRIDKVSTDKLIAYNQMVYPDLKFKIAV